MIYRLHVDDSGRVRGNANITYNDPFPTPAGSWGSGAIMGVIMHTEVGYEHNVIAEFNNPANQASATFSIGVDGHIHQYGPIGKGWYAWAEVAGNRSWYSIEHEDKGDPNNPLTPAQILASAQVVECLSNYAGFPLRITNRVDRKGFGVHYMGGLAWGGHTCPDEVPGKGPRSLQRAAILARAEQIRNESTATPTRHVSTGDYSLHAVAKPRKLGVEDIIVCTLANATASEIAALLGYMGAGNWDGLKPVKLSRTGANALMPKGKVVFWLPPAR